MVCVSSSGKGRTIGANTVDATIGMLWMTVAVGTIAIEANRVAADELRGKA
jgi:hypothetical protein